MQIHGPNNFFVHLATESLGDVCLEQGDFEKAQKLYKEALRGTIAERDNDTTSTAKILDKLATIYCHMGITGEALRHMHQAVLIRSRILGELHPDTVRTRERLSTLRGTLKQTSPLSVPRGLIVVCNILILLGFCLTITRASLSAMFGSTDCKV